MKTQLTTTFVLGALSTATLLAAPTGAQSLYGVDGPGAAIVEFSSPATAPFVCGPDGPLLESYDATDGVAPCPELTPFPGAPSIEGDLAVDRSTGTMYVTDGDMIVRYDATGAHIDSFENPLAPGVLTGMCFVTATGKLWITDGGTVASVTPPPVPGCFFAVSTDFMFSAPFGPGMFTSPITDLDWDTSLGAFVACSEDGMLGSFFIGGGAGPLGFSTTGPACPLTPPLTGIALEDAAPGSGTVYVTNGFEVSYLVMHPFGPPTTAPATFFTPETCFSVPAGPLAGLEYAGRARTFGAESPTVGSLVGSVGESYPGNADYALSLMASPGVVGVLYVGLGGPACPPIPVPGFTGLLLNIIPPYTALSTVVVPAFGEVEAPLPIPTSFSTGFALSFQWLLLDGFDVGLSKGLNLTLVDP